MSSLYVVVNKLHKSLVYFNLKFLSVFAYIGTWRWKVCVLWQIQNFLLKLSESIRKQLRMLSRFVDGFLF